MPLDHYVPACFIGRFSADTKGSLRKRQLNAYDFLNHSFFQTNAAGLMAIKDYYDPLVDQIWGFESLLPAALDALIEGSIDGKSWARVLVPFISSLFVRGPNFPERFDFRMSLINPDLGKNDRESIDSIRVLELQRILASMMSANWTVCRVNVKVNLLANDIGYIPFKNMNSKQLGIAVPIDPRNILIIEPCTARTIIINYQDQWWPNIRYATIDEGYIDDFNKKIAYFAQRFIVAPNKSLLESYVDVERTSDMKLLDPFLIGFMSGITAVVNEFAWHRLVTCLEDKPSKWGDCFLNLRYDNINKGWFPGVYLADNLPEFTPNLYRVGDEIKCSFEEVNKAEFIEQVKKYNDELE
jgi:hypothetical protein